MGLTSSKTIIPIKEADAKLGPVLRMKLDKVRMQRSVAFSGGCLFFAACICGLYPQLQAVLAFASRMRRVNPRALRYALAATDWRESTSRGPGIVLSCACPTVFVITSKKHPPRGGQTGRVHSRRPCISHVSHSFSATLSCSRPLS